MKKKKNYSTFYFSYFIPHNKNWDCIMKEK